MQTKIPAPASTGQPPRKRGPGRPPKERAAGDTADRDRQFVTALKRGLDILRCFSTERPELTATEISQMVGLPYPTVWRLCHTLSESGYIVYRGDGSRMGLGLPVLGLGYAVLARYKIAEVALPYMRALTERLKVGMTLGARDGLDMVYLQRTHGDFIHLNQPVGSRYPLKATGTGWACLAGMSDEQRAIVLDDIRRSDTKAWPAIRANIDEALQEYKRSGMVFNLGARHPELNIVAVPIRSLDGSTVLGLGASGLASIWTKTKLRAVGRELIDLSAVLAPALSNTF